MKAAYICQTGTPDAIQVGEFPAPELKDNQVLVKVTALAVNPIDTYIRSGRYQAVPPLPLPFIIGRDAVGTVEAVGSAAKKFKKGQRVWCNSLGIQGRQGSFAEYFAVDEELLYPAPSNVDDLQLVSVLHAGATAALGLIHGAMLKASDILFVNGGGGNIGTALIQLAKARGSRVFASTSGSEKIAWCKSMGADLVLDYRKDNIEAEVKKAAPQGVDVFWDTSRTPNFDLAVSLLARKGRIILMAGADARPEFPVGPFYRKECSMKGVNLNTATPFELAQCADLVNLCVERQQLKCKIARILPLEEAAAAHRLIEGPPEVWGKIVLRP